MSGTWASSWALNDIVSVAEFAKGMGSVSDTILGANAASIDLTGLPTTYAHMRIVVEARSNNATALDTLQIRFNNDTAANYYYEEVTCNATTVAASEGLGQTSGLVGRVAAASAASTSYSGTCVIELPNYASAAFRKRWQSHWSTNSDAVTTTVRIGQAGGFWNQSNAINRVTLFAGGGNLVTSTRVTVYVIGA